LWLPQRSGVQQLHGAEIIKASAVGHTAAADQFPVLEDQRAYAARRVLGGAVGGCVQELAEPG